MNTSFSDSNHSYSLLEVISSSGDVGQLGMSFTIPGGTSSTNNSNPMEVYIGRSRTNFIQLFDLTVSKVHIKVAVSQGELTLTDMGSKHGSYVNDTKMNIGEVYIFYHQDVLTIGRLKLRYQRKEMPVLKRPTENEINSKHFQKRPKISHSPMTLGEKLLHRMGWKRGTALGKTEKKSCPPIEVVKRRDRAGLGTY
jgi:hypothetical protein